MTKIALVTGANRGIGYETCRQLTQNGMTVLLTSRDEAKGRAAAAKIQREEQAEINFYALDVSDTTSIQRVRAEVERDFGRLDILVNNAAIYPDSVHHLMDVDLELLRTTMDINAYGPLYLIQHFVPLMKKHNWGRIINVSSGIGELSDLGSSYPTYRLSKIMLNIITRILAVELNGSGILINAVCPGWVRTDMGGPSAPRTVEQGADTIVWLATSPDNQPQGGFFRDRKPIDW